MPERLQFCLYITKNKKWINFFTALFLVFPILVFLTFYKYGSSNVLVKIIIIVIGVAFAVVISITERKQRIGRCCFDSDSISIIYNRSLDTIYKIDVKELILISFKYFGFHGASNELYPGPKSGRENRIVIITKINKYKFSLELENRRQFLTLVKYLNDLDKIKKIKIRYYRHVFFFYMKSKVSPH